ncbi:unnamed protein product [Chondrus crispus]|uniref:Pentacotripeptide-repeat region of PRORP domain-containing protein n=1 Tax=Chondrus crispus TaxID=2769 RepID=R7QQS3_CHOCR|nr:unnamed protein product [Chondrus crispus]CDF40088.1 unnamed protein product [Chondrus crispus]|eukprot:XP_005710382.1 unnamed protein product [Chondrus crispus]
MLRHATHVALRAARLRSRSFSSSAVGTPHGLHLRLGDGMSVKEGKSWVSMVPQKGLQHPRSRSRDLRFAGDARAAHKVLLRAGAHRSRHEADLIELLLVLLNTDEFKGPRERLEAMVNALWKSPSSKPKAAFNILLTACAREAGRVSDNSSVKRDVILKVAKSVWAEMLQTVKRVDPRNTALMYRICGECKDIELAKSIREQINDPAIFPAGGDGASLSSVDATAAFILCLGKCGRSGEAEQLYFSGYSSAHRSSDMVLSALFRSYVASNRISKAESLISMYGSGFLTVLSCNAFVKQCAALRLHDSALEFVGRMSRTNETGFPGPNAQTYNLLLRGLSAGTGTEDRDVAADRALVVVDQMKAQGIAPTTVTYNTLIRSLVFRHQMKEALELYRGMDSPNRITFSHLMQGAANIPDLELAEDIFASLVQAGERPNYGFCKSYLETIAKLKGTDAAFTEATRVSEEFGDALVFGDVGSHEAIRMALISACGKVGDLSKAFEALDLPLASHRNTVGNLAPLYVATVLMQVCLQCHAPGRALEVFDSVRGAGLKPNFEVYESLIHGLCSYVRFRGVTEAFHADIENENDKSLGDWTPNSHTLAPAENSSSDRGRHEAAQSFEQSEDGRQDRVPSGNVEANEAVRIAVELLREMHANGEGRAIRQAAYVYNTMIAAAAAINDFELALQIFNKMSNRNNQGVVYFSKDILGGVDEAQQDVGMSSEPPGGNRRPDEDGGGRARLAALASTGMFDSEYEFPMATVGTYNSMIDAAWKCGEPWYSFEVFQLMQMDRITEPNVATLSLLADIALSESHAVDADAQRKLLKELDAMAILSGDVSQKRIRLRKKLLALRWS